MKFLYIYRRYCMLYQSIIFFQLENIPLNKYNDLFYGLKGAGSSFGIATDFTYRYNWLFCNTFLCIYKFTE